MSNYHLEVKNISRGKSKSVTNAASYACGKKLYDCYHNKECCHNRSNVLFSKIFLPANAPPRFGDLQTLCNEIEKAEKRYDARTARVFIGSLPNELALDEQIRIVGEFVEENFKEKGLCAIIAIHDGKNIKDPSKDNPHVHIIVTTRTLDEKGFNNKKSRQFDKKEYIHIWREEWAKVQNRAYERNDLDIRVSHESLEVQGIYDREPTIHLTQRDWQKEQKGERTTAGDKKRDIRKRNKEKSRTRQREKERHLEMELSR